MKRDEITFYQPHWSNRSNRKSHPRKQPDKDVKDVNDHSESSHHPDQSEDDFVYVRDDSKENEIFTPLHTEKKTPGPVISPRSKVLDDEVFESESYEDNSKQEDLLGEKRKRMSSFRKEFSSMLDEEDDEPSDDFKESAKEKEFRLEIEADEKQGNPFLPQFLSMLMESSDSSEEWESVEEHDRDNEESSSFDFEDYSILTDITSSMGESPEERKSFKNYYFSQIELGDKEESSSTVIESEDSHVENQESSEAEPHLFNEISSLFHESSSLIGIDVPSFEEDPLPSTSFSIQEEVEEGSHLDFEEDFQSLLESSTESTDESSDEWDDRLKLESSSSLEFCDEQTEEEIFDHSHKKIESSLLVKVPVLLARVNIDLDLMENVHVIAGVSEITKIDFSLRSLKTKTVLPSSNVFFDGVLLADIEYVSGDTFQSRKVPVEWDKVIKVDWKTEPIIPRSEHVEYTFTGHKEQESGCHYEYCETFANPVEGQLQKIQIVSYNHAAGEGEVRIQGNVQLTVDLLQEQYVYL